MGMLVNKKQLAETFGISERSFTEYQRDPSFPIRVNAGRGSSNQYDTAEVYEWLQLRAADKGRETQKERLDRLNGDKAELDIAERIGALVPSEEVERRLTDVAVAIRTGTMTGNSKLKNELDLQYGIEVDIGILNTHARHILTHLASLFGESGSGGELCPAETNAAAPDVEHGVGEHLPVDGS